MSGAAAGTVLIAFIFVLAMSCPVIAIWLVVPLWKWWRHQ